MFKEKETHKQCVIKSRLKYVTYVFCDFFNLLTLQKLILFNSCMFNIIFYDINYNN